MRSQLVFRAHEAIGNKFQLCRTVAKITRCLHFYSSCTQDAISDALVKVAQTPFLMNSDSPSRTEFPGEQLTEPALPSIKAASAVLIQVPAYALSIPMWEQDMPDERLLTVHQQASMVNGSFLDSYESRS